MKKDEDTTRRVAVIVAHPDDEVIWSGGLILSHPEWDWTVLSLCRADDPDRRPKFLAVCERLGAAGFICDLDDGNPLAPIDPSRDIAPKVLEHLGDASWDLCLTHGANGEYGHLRHKQVHAAVVKLVGEAALACEQLWTFAYRRDPHGEACVQDGGADILLIDLDERQQREKVRIVRADYGYGEDSFEVRSCVWPESFRRRVGPRERHP